MRLVHEDKAKSGRWQIAWMWMPHFLASDSDLHKFVAEKMTERFSGTVLENDSAIQSMHDRVIELVLEKYPIEGLKEYLGALENVEPDGL